MVGKLQRSGSSLLGISNAKLALGRKEMKQRAESTQLCVEIQNENRDLWWARGWRSSLVEGPLREDTRAPPVVPQLGADGFGFPPGPFQVSLLLPVSLLDLSLLSPLVVSSPFPRLLFFLPILLISLVFLKLTPLTIILASLQFQMYVSRHRKKSH